MPKPSTPSSNVTLSYDSLTGALTRPSLVAVLREQAQGDGHAFCICLVDVDQLQNINDREGVRTGDAVLAALARRLRAVLDESPWHALEHTLARYDGDALMVLSRRCDSARGERLAEALRLAVAAAPMYERVGITVSIGVAQFRLGESIDELLARTERSLHLAKQFGRDRVELADTPRQRSEPATVLALRANANSRRS